MAKALAKHHEVTVLAPLPNYPTGSIFNGYKGMFFLKESLEGFTARRYWTYNTISKSAVKRGLSMFSFGFSMLFEIRHWLREPPELVIVQNSPLLVSSFAIFYLKLFTKTKIVLNVSDLWPLSALELGAMKKGTFYFLLERLELYNYRKSVLILGQSQEIIDHVSRKVSDKAYFLYRNIPVLKTTKEGVKVNSEEKSCRLVYAGLLGVAQGVIDICHHIDFKALGVEFHIYGKGNELEQIEHYIDGGKDTNVFYKGSFDADTIREKLKTYDFALVPLRNRIYGAVPSKIFELTLLHVPILFCGGGEGAEIIEKEGIGLVSEPGNFDELAENIAKSKQLSIAEYKEMVEKCKTLARERYDFQTQIVALNKVLNDFSTSASK
jgi:glycosyltransferase involved in cell wall biosynthesis